MTQDEMFEKQFQRPKNYFSLSDQQKWDIDKELGILDWDGRMSPDQNQRYRKHWGLPLLSGGEGVTQKQIKEVKKELKKYNSKDARLENINHPQYYGGDTTYEAIKVIEAWGLDFCLGNTVKYISRAGKKDPTLAKEIEDLEKAAWYLNRKITQLKGE